MSAKAYEQTARTLEERIAALVPTHPEILTMESPWPLFRIKGFDCADLQPSLAQAQYALAKVQADARRGGCNG